MIEVRKLVKSFGLKPVLRGIDFSVEAGEFVAVLGPNGVGKTTFIRILASLAKADLGEVRIAGLLLPQQAGLVRRRLGVVSHQPLIYGDLTGEENLRFYGRMYAVANLNDRIAHTLELVGLQQRKSDLTRQYSRGMQQRLAIARALLHDPEVLLLDEPHTGLDQDASAMLDELLTEVGKQGRTVVMTSHDLKKAAVLASRVDILARGRLTASYRSDEFSAETLPKLYEEAMFVS
jgi:heme exporter protein A